MERDTAVNKETLLYIGVGFRNYDELIINELQSRFHVLYINSKEFDMRHVFFYSIARKHCKKLLEKFCAKCISKRIYTVRSFET